MVMPDINPSVSKHERSLQIPLVQNWRMAMIPSFQVVIKHQDDQLEEICDSSTELWPYDFRKKKRKLQPAMRVYKRLCGTNSLFPGYIYTNKMRIKLIKTNLFLGDTMGHRAHLFGYLGWSIIASSTGCVYIYTHTETQFGLSFALNTSCLA